MKTLNLIKPDDFHVHLRDGSMLQLVVTHSARGFGRILVMPNLNPPIETVSQALTYRDRILNILSMNPGRGSQLQKSYRYSKNDTFRPLMSLYLTNHTTRKMVQEAALENEVIGFKFYPAHATTQSQFGIRDIRKVFTVLEEMEKRGVYLMIHGEDTSVDIFDREKVFVDKTLSLIVKKFPALKITLEHVTTSEAVDFINEAPLQVAASVTPHHLLLDRDDLLSKGIKPHYYCMPIVKRNTHRDYLLATILSGHRKFFLGSDSAPHWEKHKTSACGCAGIYSAPVVLSLLAQLFEDQGVISRLENFTSVFGARHYGLEPNSRKITLVKEPWRVPQYYLGPEKKRGRDRLIPFRCGETLSWKVS